MSKSQAHSMDLQVQKVQAIDALLPPFKWAGGKRWLIQQYRSFFPSNFDRLVEPFFGGGSVFFMLQPCRAILSDINSELINAYNVIREQWADLESLLEMYDDYHCTAFYYQLRSSRPLTPLRRAARFIYLNRTCWNGLYRVNQRGEFNVPIGTKSDVVLETDDFEAVSRALQKADLRCRDFEDTISEAAGGDFLFVDPPYTINHNKNGFIKYNEAIFSWADQVRLRNAVQAAANRGANVLVTNAAHKSIVELYEGLGQIEIVQRRSVISGGNQGRGQFGEAIIKCF